MSVGRELLLEDDLLGLPTRPEAAAALIDSPTPARPGAIPFIEPRIDHRHAPAGPEGAPVDNDLNLGAGHRAAEVVVGRNGKRDRIAKAVLAGVWLNRDLILGEFVFLDAAEAAEPSPLPSLRSFTSSCIMPRAAARVGAKEPLKEP